MSTFITTNNPAISVTVFRVTSGHGEANEKAIDLIVDCPTNYAFTDCILDVTRSDNAVDSYDLSGAIFNGGLENHWNIIIPLGRLGITDNAIYKMQLKAKEYKINTTTNGDGEEKSEVIWEDSELSEIIYTSDVEGTFNCMLSHILNSNECGELPDDVIRNYLILFGHQAALREHNVELAWEYFKLLNNCFDKCGAHHHQKSCNCGR